MNNNGVLADFRNDILLDLKKVDKEVKATTCLMQNLYKCIKLSSLFSR